MDTLPDAVPAQTNVPSTKAANAATTEAPADGGSFGIKVEGMLGSRGAHPANKTCSLMEDHFTDGSLTDYPKFDLESYIANYTGQ